MNRVSLIEILKPLYPTHNIGQHYQHDVNPYIVLRAGYQRSGTNNIGSKKGALQTYEILCYVPDTSIIGLDTMLEEVRKELLKYKDIEVLNELSVDYHDTVINMYMRYMSVHAPKGV